MRSTSPAPRRILATVAAGAMLAAAPLAGASGAAGMARAGHPAPGHARTLPRFLYAPYFETWTSDSLPRIAGRSGAKFLTLAFLQTPKKGSCTVAWNGKKSQEVKPGGRYTAQVTELRRAGGDVIPSFGGYSADQDGTEIADSCTSVAKIARAYESVVTTYGVTRLDMDVEARSLGNKAGIARRSAAIALLQRWAARHHRPVQIVFTLGVEPAGLPGNCLAILKSALAAGVRITAVNIMAFDYYNSHTDSDMGTEAIQALNSTHRQLAKLYPHLGSRQLWRKEGITLLPGIDDFPKKTEVTYLSEAQDVQYFLRAGHPAAMVSIWALQRDNGGCPGTIDSNTCSGIAQPKWAFSHLLEGYTRR